MIRIRRRRQRRFLDGLSVGSRVRLAGHLTVDGVVREITKDAVWVDDPELGELEMRPRHSWLDDGRGRPVDAWRICNVVLQGEIKTIAADFHSERDTVIGHTSI